MDDAFGGDGPAMTMQFYAFLTASVNDDRFSWFIEVAMVGTFRIDSKDSVADLAHGATMPRQSPRRPFTPAQLGG